jgi:predicted protein tyrosine phosphatase
MLFRRHPTVQARSAGTASSARRKVTQALVDWADRIYCMEQGHARQLKQRFSIGCEIKVLDIPDDFQFNDPELVEILEDHLSEFLT